MRSYGSIIYSDLPFLRLATEFPHQLMLAEATRLLTSFVSHREYEAATSGWSALVIHGIGPSHTLGYEAYGLSREEQEGAYSWTSAANECPVTTYFFQHVLDAGTYARIRFMRLAAGGRVPFHTDYTERKLASMSFALNHPPGFRFLMKTPAGVVEVPFQPGAAFALNLSYEHSVVNSGAEDRYHIIAHVLRGSPRYRELIVESFSRSSDVRQAEVDV